MTEREFWLALRRLLMGVCRVIEKRYGPVEKDARRQSVK